MFPVSNKRSQHGRESRRHIFREAAGRLRGEGGVRGPHHKELQRGFADLMQLPQDQDHPYTEEENDDDVGLG